MRRIIKQSIKNKKGQAAMEFLMTYGWAILAAIIAIGVLAYFGVFNPGRLVGQTGIVTAPFNLVAFNLENDDEGGLGLGDIFNFEMTHNAGETIEDIAITITLTSPSSVTCTVAEVGTACQGGTVSCIGVGNLWESGVTAIFTADCGDNTVWSSGGQGAADVTVTYQKQGSAIDLSSTGNMRGTVP